MPEDLSEFEPWAQDIDRLDELVGLCYSIALSTELDFDEALRATYVMLELIGMRNTLLKSYVRGTL
jgi:hypothetical protein